MQTTDTEVLRFHFVMIFFFFSLCLSAPKIDYFQLGYFDVFFLCDPDLIKNTMVNCLLADAAQTRLCTIHRRKNAK